MAGDRLLCVPRPDWEARTLLGRVLAGAVERSGHGGLRAAEIGLARKWVYLVTEEGQVGLAFAEASAPLPVDELEGRELAEIAGLAWQHPLLTSAALAAANAAEQARIERGEAEAPEEDFVELLGLTGSERVAMVGYVHGVAAAVAERAGSLVVYEDNPVHAAEAREAGLEARPGSQLLVEAGGYAVVVATGASLVDPRLYSALLLAPRRPRLAMVGPTSSFPEEAARGLGLYAYGGVYVPPGARRRLLKLVKAGYGFRGLRGLVAKWSRRPQA